MLSCYEKMGYTAYEVVYVYEGKKYNFMGKKKLMTIPKQYWSLQIVETIDETRDIVNKSIEGMFNQGILLQTILFVNEMKFVKGKFNFIGFTLNDGTKMQEQFLCFSDGKCVNLAKNIVQLGTGRPPSDNKNQKKQKVDGSEQK